MAAYEVQSSASLRYLGSREQKWAGKRITLLRNSNNDFKGNVISVNEKKFPTFDKFLEEVSQSKKLRKIYLSKCQIVIQI